VGAGLQSLLQIAELRRAPEGSVQSLCAHGNNIASLEGVDQLTSLTDLNLSSNLITATWALQGLSSLRKLDLASNQLQSVDALGGEGPNLPTGAAKKGVMSRRKSKVCYVVGAYCVGLPCLEVLLLAHNYIRDLSGLVPTNGGLQALARLDLRNNRSRSPSPPITLLPYPHLYPTHRTASSQPLTASTPPLHLHSGLLV
jgi:Leucine-rich repeat (LRR) protein